MKKILLSTRDFNIGGIEKALINLINYLLEKKYDVTLVVEQKEGNLFEEINENINIIKYTPSNVKNILLRKILNLIKRCNFIIKYKNRFDTSISFATYSQSGSFVTRVASKNPILWCHADYLCLFNGDKSGVKSFFKKLHYKEFSKIVFVSKKAQESFLQIFPEQKNTVYCNNLIDYRRIYEQSKQKIDLQYDDRVTTFLNVGRHDEKQKRLSRIIEASKILKQENYKFRVIFVGSGKDTEKYKKLVNNYGLQEIIIFVGAKKNPYPYFKISDCVVLSSDYEGYPVVFLESYVLDKPIITTDISDISEIQNKRGIVAEKSSKGIYAAMKSFLENGMVIKEKFNIKGYNKEVKETLDEVL